MEIKYVKIPFDVELAKKITNGEVEGKVVTRDGQRVRIVCFDALRSDSLVVLITEGTIEKTHNYTPDGRVFINDEASLDLMLEVPEYMTFKDGDILSNYMGDFVFMLNANGDYKTSMYACVGHGGLTFGGAANINNIDYYRFATKKEKTRLIDALKESKEPEAKECLKKLGIEEKENNTMTLNEYQKKALETEDYQDELKIILPTLGLTGEAGEVADKVKKVLRDNNGEFTDERKEEIAKELGDVAWYLAVSANSIGYTLEEICKMNIDKIESRFVRGKIHGEGDNR